MAQQQDNNLISKLKKLGALYKDGLLTKEEFEEQKRRILSEETRLIENSSQDESQRNPTPHTVSDNQPATNPSTPPKDTRRQNNRIVVIAIIAVVIIAAAIVIPLSLSHKREAERKQQLEMARLDSIQREAARLEALRFEEARLDSIRQDSIAFEEKMRLSPQDLISASKTDDYTNYKFRDNIPNILKEKGFTKGKTEVVGEDFDDISGGSVTYYRIVFKREINGRQITINYFYSKYVNAPSYKNDSYYFEFSDEGDMDDFVRQIKDLKLGHAVLDDGRHHYHDNEAGIAFYVERDGILMVEYDGI